MKTYTLEELDKIFLEETYPYVALFSNTNKMMVPYPANSAVKKGKAGWERVRKRLESNGLSDGYYTIKGKSSPLKNIAPDIFYFKKGNVQEKDLPTVQLAEAPKEKADRVLTYDAAIASNKEISDLTAEVKALKLEIEQQDERIADLEHELSECEEEIEGLSENGGISDSRKYMEDLVITAVPILDRYFDVQEKRIELRKQELNGGQRIAPPPSSAYQSPEVQRERQQEQQPRPTKEDAKEFWDKMGVLLESDPAEYQRVMQKLQDEQGFEQVDDE